MQQVYISPKSLPVLQSLHPMRLASGLLSDSWIEDQVRQTPKRREKTGLQSLTSRYSANDNQSSIRYVPNTSVRLQDARQLFLLTHPPLTSSPPLPVIRFKSKLLNGLIPDPGSGFLLTGSPAEGVRPLIDVATDCHRHRRRHLCPESSAITATQRRERASLFFSCRHRHDDPFPCLVTAEHTET